MSSPLRERRIPAGRIAAISAAIAASSLVASAAVDWRAPRPEGEPRILSARTRSGLLLAGAGKAKVELPAGAVLAGYRPFGREAKEGGETTFARALILEVGGLRTAIVSVELMTLPPSLASRIDDRVRAEGAACSLIAATHTHSGPGGYDRALVPQAVAVGRFDPAVEVAILDAVSASLAAADAELAPADLSQAEERIPVGRSRDRRGAPVDDRLTALRFTRPDGTPVAEVARFAAHPTLNPREVGPSGDWPGEAMRAREEEGGVTLILQGAVGDARADVDAMDRLREGGWQALGFYALAGRNADDAVLPNAASGSGSGSGEPGVSSVARGDGGGLSGAASFGRGIATMLGALPFREASAPVALGCAEVEFDLPQADLRAMVPGAFGTLVSNLGALQAPESARITALRADDLVLLAVPAEPTFGAVAAAEDAVAKAGLRGRTVSLAEGYVGYAPTPEDVEARVFSSRYSWFGAALAGRLSRGAQAAATALLARQGGDRDLSDRPDDPAAPDGSMAGQSR